MPKVVHARTGALDDFPLLRQARAHAIRERVRWGGPYVYCAAPGILSWVVLLVRSWVRARD